METFINFFTTYGLWLTGIALFGVALLGALKYLGAFKKFGEKTRHYVYLGIVTVYCAAATAIYLAAADKFSLPYYIAALAAMFAINQTAYNVFDALTINEFISKYFGKFVELLKHIMEKKDNGGLEDEDGDFLGGW